MRPIRVTPLEQLHVGKRQLSGIDIVSPDAVFTAVPPSTMLGVLGQLAGIDLGQRVNGSNASKQGIEAIKQGVEAMCRTAHELKYLKHEACINVDVIERPLMWGPLAEVEGFGFHVLIGEDKMLRMDSVRDYVKAALASSEGHVVKVPELVKLQVIERVGIALSRETRTADRGKIYNPAYSTYVVKYGKGYRRVSIVYWVDDEVVSRLRIPSVQRVGGEGRLAYISIAEVNARFGEGEYAVVLSPLLFESENDGYARVGKSHGLGCVDEVYGVLSNKDFKVKVINIGLGFSEVYGVRRPMLNALPPGTVVKLRNNGDCGKTQAVGLFCWLGYGSLLRIHP